MTEIGEKRSFIGRYAKLLVVLATIAGATSGIFANLTAAPPLAIGFWRLPIALPFFAVPVFTKGRDTLKTLTGRDIGISLLAGLFLFVHYFNWFSAVKLTNVSSASVLAALHPLVVLVAMVFVFKQKVGIRPVLGIVLALLGGAMVAGFDYTQMSQGDFKGDICAFLAAFGMGVYFVLGNEARKTVAGPTYVMLCFFACWVCFTIGMVATHTPFLAYTVRDFLCLIALALVCQIGAHGLFNLCMGHVNSLYVSAVETADPVFATILGVIVLHQIPSVTAVVGCIVVVLGLLYFNYWTSQKPA